MVSIPPQGSNAVDLDHDGELRSRKFCLRCGGISDTDANYCQQCGTPFRLPAGPSPRLPGDVGGIQEAPGSKTTMGTLPDGEDNASKRDLLNQYTMPIPTRNGIGSVVGGISQMIDRRATLALFFVLTIICVALSLRGRSLPAYPTSTA